MPPNPKIFGTEIQTPICALSCGHDDIAKRAGLADRDRAGQPFRQASGLGSMSFSPAAFAVLLLGIIASLGGALVWALWELEQLLNPVLLRLQRKPERRGR